MGTSVAGSTSRSSDPQEADEVADGTERRQALRDDRQEDAEIVVAGHPVDPAGGQLGGDERAQALDEVVRLEPPDPLAVEPFEPLAVEDGAALVDGRQVEALDDLVDREDLLLGPGRPAEQRQVVDERFADEALGDVVGDRRLALALAHLRPVGIEDERQVGEARHRVAERPEEQDVLGRVREMVLAPDHVGHLHRRIVDDDREVVERRAVAADDHEIAAEVRDVDLDPSADDVVEGDHAGPDPEADGRRTTLGLARGALVGRQRGTPADVAGWLPGRFLGLAVGIELLGRAIAGIGLVLGEQAPGRLGIDREAKQLAVRGERAARRLAGDLGTLVPAEPEPVQPVEDVLLERDRVAGLVGVLEAEHERAARVTGVEIVEQRRPGGADVERPGRARRDAHADRGIGAGHGKHGSRSGAAAGRVVTGRTGTRASFSAPGPCGTGRDPPRRATRG